MKPPQFRKTSSLRLRLLAPFLFVGLIGSALSTHSSVSISSARLRSEALRNTRILCEFLGSQCSVAVALGDKTWLDRLVGGAMENPDIVYCSILDKDGRVLAFRVRYAEAKIDERNSRCLKPLPTPVPTLRVCTFTSNTGEDILEIVHPLFFENSSEVDDAMLFGSVASKSKALVGYSRIGVSLERQERQIFWERAEMLAVGTVATMVSLALLALLLNYAIVPIRQVAKAAVQVADGALDKKVSLNSSDEIGELVSAFNHMVERLSQSRSFNDLVGNTIPLGLLLLDENGVITQTNRHAGTLLDFRDGELLGRAVDSVIDDSSFRRAQDNIGDGSDEEHFQLTIERRPPDASAPIRVFFEGLLVRVPETAATTDAYAMVLLHDVTALENQRAQTRHMEKRLMQSEKLASLGQLSAGIAHEFNNVLQIIGTYTELSIDLADNESIARNLSKVLDGTERASNIVSGLLAFSRRLTPHRRPTDIKRIVEETLDLVGFSFPKANVELSTNLQEVPLTAADSGQLQQVLINLFNNAIHAMTPGGGKLTVSVKFLANAPSPDPPTGSLLTNTSSGDEEHKFSRKGAIEITVSDTGCGISEEDLSRIFEPFFSTKGIYGKTQEARLLPGTGLGLALSYGIITSHHGEISVKSTRGKGTSFIILLPVLKQKKTVPIDKG